MKHFIKLIVEGHLVIIYFEQVVHYLENRIIHILLIHNYSELLRMDSVIVSLFFFVGALLFSLCGMCNYNLEFMII